MAGGDDRFDSDLGMLIRQAQGGSEEAARAVVERLGPALSAVIRHILKRPLRRLYDSDDFLMETFEEVFTRTFREEVLASPAVLWSYLKRIAENKVREAQRRYDCARRDLNRDVPLEALERDEALARQRLSAEEWGLLKQLVEERLQQSVAQLPPVYRAIVTLVLRGSSAATIAQQLQLTPRTVQRVVASCFRRMLST